MNIHLDILNKASVQKWGFWSITMLLLLLLIWINGISLIPHQHYQRLAQDPLTTRYDIDSNNYFQETALLTVLAYILGWTDPVTFNGLCFILLLAAYFFFAEASRRKFSISSAVLITALMLSNPISTILLSWLGSPDSLTFFLTVPLLFTVSHLLIFLLALAGVTNHIVFLFAAFEILVLRWSSNDGIKPSHIFTQLIGGVIGYLLLWLFLDAYQIEVASRLEYVLSRDLETWSSTNSTYLPQTLFSFFNIQWIIALICTIMFFRRNKPFYMLVWIFLLFNYSITFFTLDKTRIFLLLSWAILIQCIFYSCFLNLQEKADKQTPSIWFNRFLGVIALFSFLMPRFYSWDGRIILSGLWKLILGALS